MTPARTWHVQGCTVRAGTWRKVNKVDDTWKKVLNLWTETFSFGTIRSTPLSSTAQLLALACPGLLRLRLFQ